MLAKKERVLMKINVTAQIKADKKSGKRGVAWLAGAIREGPRGCIPPMAEHNEALVLSSVRVG